MSKAASVAVEALRRSIGIDDHVGFGDREGRLGVEDRRRVATAARAVEDGQRRAQLEPGDAGDGDLPRRCGRVPTIAAPQRLRACCVVAPSICAGLQTRRPAVVRCPSWSNSSLTCCERGRHRTVRGLDFAVALEVDRRVGPFRQRMRLEAAVGVQDERPDPDHRRPRGADEQRRRTAASSAPIASSRVRIIVLLNTRVTPRVAPRCQRGLLAYLAGLEDGALDEARRP